MILGEICKTRTKIFFSPNEKIVENRFASLRRTDRDFGPNWNLWSGQNSFESFFIQWIFISVSKDALFLRWRLVTPCDVIRDKSGIKKRAPGPVFRALSDEHKKRVGQIFSPEKLFFFITVIFPAKPDEIQRTSNHH